MIGKAKKSTLRTYIKTNAPPPFSAVIQGNFQIFPKPTADPVAANTNSNFEDHWP